MKMSYLRVGVFSFGLACVFGFGATTTLFLTKPEKPFLADDARRVIRALAPLTDGGIIDTSVFLWANGDVNVSVRIDGSYFRGRGNDINAAVADLAHKSSKMNAAITALDRP